MYIKTNDTVVVIAGREKGKTGRVTRVDTHRSRVYVEGLNIVKRHQRPNAVDSQGGIIEKVAPLNASNVLLYSEKLERGVRVSYRFVGRGGEFHTTRKAAQESFGEDKPPRITPPRITKVRLCVKTGEVF